MTTTAAFTLYVVSHKATIAPAISNQGSALAVLLVYLFASCALLCCHRSVPLNYLLLAIITACVSWDVGFVSLETEPVVVLEAALLTAAMTIAITVYAMTTVNDFTTSLCNAAAIIVTLTVLLAAQILGFIFGFSLGLLGAGLLVTLFGFYILWDI